MTHDDLEFYRKFALNALQGCLEKKPEMEDVILEIIINKLGDSSKRVQCHTIYLLLKLSQAHIEMTEVIVHSVNLFLQRNHSKPSHVYYSVAYLNRIASMVAPKDERVRLMLLRVYFSLFR
jgi:beta-xylosidase